MTNEITSDLIAQRVRRYTPKRLDAAAWNACREAVVQAVLAVRPPTLLEADYYTTHLCLFLASLTRRQWDRVGAPDVRLLLTEAAIEAFTSREGMPGKADNTRKTARTRLRWLHSAVHQVELAPLEPRAASEVARRFWGSVLELSPFTALVAGYERLGHSLHISSWVNLSKELATDLSVLLEPASATDNAAGTVDASRLGAAALREAAAPRGVMAVTHASNVTSKSQKTVSRAAALRQAKASLVAKPLIADVPELAPELSVMIDGWCPQGVADAIWSPVADVAAIAMAAYAPASTSSVMNIRSIVADYCLWVHARPARSACGDLTAEELLAEGLLEHYFAGPVSERPHATQGTVRSVLRRVVRNLRPGKRPEPIAYTPVQAPYSEAECASFVLLARHQPTVHGRRELSSLIALGLGAGLSAEDSRKIAPCHIHELDLGDGVTTLAIRVPGEAPRGRVVIMRSAYVPLLLEAVQLHQKSRRGTTKPLYGNSPARRNGASHVTERAVTAIEQGVDISAARLRTTWLVACLSSPVPFGALMHAAGLKSPRTFTDLLRFCPAPDPVAVERALAAVATTKVVVQP